MRHIILSTLTINSVPAFCCASSASLWNECTCFVCEPGGQGTKGDVTSRVHGHESLRGARGASPSFEARGRKVRREKHYEALSRYKSNLGDCSPFKYSDYPIPRALLWSPFPIRSSKPRLSSLLLSTNYFRTHAIQDGGARC
jgi:hypothetical protein